MLNGVLMCCISLLGITSENQIFNSLLTYFLGTRKPIKAKIPETILQMKMTDHNKVRLSIFIYIPNKSTRTISSKIITSTELNIIWLLCFIDFNFF